MRDNDRAFERLYALQDLVLGEVARLDPGDFYLTGGTALNRFFHSARYSDDLDFFSFHEDPLFRSFVDRFVRDVRIPGAGVSIEMIADHFCRMFVRTGDVLLKVDFVSDMVFRHGDILGFPAFPRVDNKLNILANKVTAISRHEVKDVVDMWTIARTTAFSWREVMEIAGKKSPVDPLDVAQTLRSMPEEDLALIKWVEGSTPPAINEDICRMIRDITLGNANSLAP